MAGSLCLTYRRLTGCLGPCIRASQGGDVLTVQLVSRTAFGKPLFASLAGGSTVPTGKRINAECFPLCFPSFQIWRF